MRQRVLLAMLLIMTTVPMRGTMAQSSQIAIATPHPHFVATWAPTKEHAAERAAALAHRVSLVLQDVSLDAALKGLIKQAGLRLTYTPSVLPEGKRVTINANNIAVVTALTEMLFRSGLDVVMDRDDAMALVACRHPRPEPAAQDSGKIVGRVTDDVTGAPIAGATVVVEGTRLLATSAGDGRYDLPGVATGTHSIRVRYIGYTPAVVLVTLGSDQPEVVADFTMTKSAQQLEQVVVTGTLAPTEVKALPTPISVISGDRLRDERLSRVDQLFRGEIPGSIAWDLGAYDYSSTVQVRGRNSLTATPSIKTYIDGVEVANPVYIASIDPNSIERVEITRGPQASTIYGSDASGGVMQIFTKGGSAGPTPQAFAKAGFGAIEGPFSSGLPLRQDYALSVSGGADDLSYHVTGSYLQTGEWMPGYYSRAPNLSAKAAWSQGRIRAELTGRYSAKTFAFVHPPALRHLSYFSRPAYEEDRLRQQTLGLALSWSASSRWEHNLIAGVDRMGYDLNNTRARLTTEADTFLQVLTSNTAKPSVRYNTTYHADLSPSVSAVVTGGAEYYHADFTNDYTADATRSQGTIDGTHFVTRTSYGNTGFFGQLQVGIHQALFLTGGLRGERNDNFGQDYGTAWSPRVGLAYSRPVGPAMIKLRGSYGSAIRAVDPQQREAFRNPFSNQIANSRLGPERQDGWDAGVDVYFTERVSLGVTYYDQTAKDLIDIVYLDASTSPPVSQNQNVGRIKNRGWELESRVELGQLSLGGTYSHASSTVLELGPSYAGDLRVGDALLEVPANTAGVTISYAPWPGTHLSSRMTRIGGWTGTDWLALYGVFFGSDVFRGSTRDYWIDYPSVTKLNASVTQRLTRRLNAFVQVDNLGNNGRFEQSNIVTPTGRTTTVGMEFRY
ncbi:MAG: TonB-dependent receptor [Gemmatimonadales bacterium]|nr:TonB-dependent receptor [Gemmatimonadales bacterium]